MSTDHTPEPSTERKATTVDPSAISLHEVAARAHEAAADAHEWACELVEITMHTPTEENEFVEVEQCWFAFAATDRALAATKQANEKSGPEAGAEMCADARSA